MGELNKQLDYKCSWKCLYIYEEGVYNKTKGEANA